MVKESISTALILRHSDISTRTTTQTVDNAVGGWSNYKQTVYWNIDLKSLLGEQWNNYNIFGIRLMGNVSTGVTYPTSGTLDVVWNSYISGLNWVNSSYSVGNKCNTHRAPLAFINVPNNSNGLNTFIDNRINYFSKGNSVVRLQLEHFRITDGSIIQSTVGLPHGCFMFEIYIIE